MGGEEVAWMQMVRENWEFVFVKDSGITSIHAFFAFLVNRRTGELIPQAET